MEGWLLCSQAGLSRKDMEALWPGRATQPCIQQAQPLFIVRRATDFRQPWGPLGQGFVCRAASDSPWMVNAESFHDNLTQPAPMTPYPKCLWSETPGSPQPPVEVPQGPGHITNKPQDLEQAGHFSLCLNVLP